MSFDGDYQLFAPHCMLPELHSMGWRRIATAQLSKLGHAHEGYEIAVILRGRLEWWVEDKKYIVGPGMMFITGPGERHGGVDGIYHPCEIVSLVIEFPPEGGALAGLSPQETRDLRAALDAFGTHQMIDNHNVRSHLEAIIREHMQPSRWSLPRVRSAVAATLVAAVRNHEDYLQSGRIHPGFSRAVSKGSFYIEKHHAQQLTVEQVADAADVSQTILRERFAAEVGISPMEYLAWWRCTLARQRLAQTDDRITRIAMDLGFSSSQYFATTFKRLVGMSPGAYRQRHGLASGEGAATGQS